MSIHAAAKAADRVVVPGGRLLGRGRHGDTWAVAAAGVGAHRPRVVVKRLAGLAAAAAEVEVLRDRLAGVEAAVAPLAALAVRGDLWVVYPWTEGSAPSEAAPTLGPALAPAVVEAVGRLHAAGLAHGALSEGNVRVGPDGAVRLLEAGLADLGREPGASQADDRRALRALLAGPAGAGAASASTSTSTATSTAATTAATSSGRRWRVRPARRISVVTSGAVLGLVASGGAVAVARTIGDGRVPAPPAPRRTTMPSPTARPSPTAMTRPLPPPGRRPPADCAPGHVDAPPGSVVEHVDMSGSGCVQQLVWRDGVARTTAPDGTLLRFSIGRPGDVLVVGHWRCARAQLPAVYRPSSGQVFYVTVWPRPGRSSTSLPAVDTGVRDGRPVVVGTPSCQRVEVAP